MKTRFDGFSQEEVLRLWQSVQLNMDGIRKAMFDPSNYDMPPRYFLLEILRNELRCELDNFDNIKKG